MNYWIEDIEQSADITIKMLHYEPEDRSDIDLSVFNRHEQEQFNEYKSVKRQLEFFYTRILWDAFNHPDNIVYRETGKPTVEKGYLSISHSHQSIVIAYSPEQELGIDIEPISDKIKRVRHKFMHPDETFESLEDLTKAWCIKEAVYKLMDMDDVFFMDNIYLESVASNSKATIKVEGVNVEPRFMVKSLGNGMMMSWAYLN